METPKSGTKFTSKSLDFEKKMILQKISQMTNLPTPGAEVMKVMLLLRDEEVIMKELIEAIGKNQALVARLLKLINSGYYGLRKTIDSVDRAINLLGILKVKQVVYSASIMDIFTKEEQQEWNHAYSASVLISNIMQEHDIPAASNLPLTVLMHDIGKIILRRFSPKKYTMVIEHSVKEKVPITIAEESLLSINHATAGSWLLEKWQMTEDIYVPVANHHSVELPSEYVLETALLQFVNWVDCMAREIPCNEPTVELMTEAGFEDIDHDYWINYQREMIKELETKPEDGETEEDKETTALAQMASSVEKKRAQPQDPGTIQIPSSNDGNYQKTSTEKIKKMQASKETEHKQVSEDKTATSTVVAVEKTQKVDMDAIAFKKHKHGASFLDTIWHSIIQFFGK